MRFEKLFKLMEGSSIPFSQLVAQQQDQFNQQTHQAQQKFNGQVQQSQQRFNDQKAAADRGEQTAAPNPAQKTNTAWAQKNGFRSIRDFYADIMKRLGSSDRAVRAGAEEQEKQYYRNIAADKARM